MNDNRIMNQDDVDMARLGKNQDLKRNFRLASTLGFSCILMATWESTLITSGIGLKDGGAAGMIYTFIGTFLGIVTTGLSLAEIASISPTAGGQYHWVSEFAPRSSQRFLSYITGWLSVLGYQAAFASLCFVCSGLIGAFLITSSSDPTSTVIYAPEGWHKTLLTTAAACLATFVNIWCSDSLASMESLLLLLHFFGFFAVLIPLWVMGDMRSGEEVFQTFSNTGGWPSMTLACLVGQLAPLYSFAGVDAVVHIAEEVHDASKIVPLCMVATILLNGCLGFIMLITFLYTMGDIMAVTNGPTEFAFLKAFENATGSSKTAIGLGSIILVMELCACISSLATSSRQTFAFARDNGLPGSKFLARVSPKSRVPIYAVTATMATAILLSMLNIFSTAAFNAAASLALVSLLSTYVLSIGAFITARMRSASIPSSRFSLGRLGFGCNILALIHLAIAIVFCLFPDQSNVDVKTMNWAILVWTVVLIFATAQYFSYGRHKYRDPRAHISKHQ